MLAKKTMFTAQVLKVLFGALLVITAVYFVMPSDAQNNPKGDVDCSTGITADDGLLLLKYSLNLADAKDGCTELGANELNTTLGDVNADGAVNGLDALFVYQCAENISNALCPGNPASSQVVVSIIELDDMKTAVEKTDTPAHIKISHNSTIAANQTLTVKYSLSGTTDSTRTSAESDDYTLTVDDGQAADGELTFAAGESAKTLIITPVNDNKIEVPERLTITVEPNIGYVVGDSSSKEVFIADDAPGITADSLLLVGLMSPEGDAVTTASGVAVLRVSNDHSYGLIDYTFTGLTTPQTAAHLHYGPTSGPVVTGIGLGQVADYRWDIEASFLSPNDQHMLDTLLAGTLYVNAHSTRYPAGEIRGNLIQSIGAPDMLAPEPTPAYETLTEDNLDRDISRFLTQATFGATQAEFDALKQRVVDNNGDRIQAYDMWLDAQMSFDSPSMLDFYKAYTNMYTSGHTVIGNNKSHASYGISEGWYTSALFSKAPLRERVGLALSEIFVISLQDNNIRFNPWGATSYHDMLRANAFGSYETLLGDVSRHPSMGWYLSHFRNQMDVFGDDGELLASPDENYAREIMQLFSIGLVNLHPDGTLKLNEDGVPTQTYTQDDITELARVFTGWGFAVEHPDKGITADLIVNDNFNFNGHGWQHGQYHENWRTPMKMFETNGKAETAKNFQRYHDNGQKVIMGNIFPAEQTGEADLQQAVNMLSNHATTAPFISYRLIQRLVTANPSRNYIYRVATVFDDSNGDLGAVVKAILLDPEARNLQNSENATFGKKREPLIQAVGIMRGLGIESNIDAFDSIDTLKTYGLSDAQVALYESNASIVGLSLNQDAKKDYFGQAALAPPTVFNFFNPFYAVAGQMASNGLVGPEFQTVTNRTSITHFNFYQDLLFVSSGLRAGFNKSSQNSDAVDTYLVFADPAYLTAPYMAQLDGNDSGGIDEADVAAFDDDARDLAVAGLLETADLLHCGGQLTAGKTGDATADPYQIIFDGLVDAHDYQDGTTIEDAQTALTGRIRMVLYFMGTAPVCQTQQ